MDKDIAKIVDQTNIQKDATAKDIVKTCWEAKIYGFRGVCVNSDWVKLVKKELISFKEIKTICLIDPPLGDSPQKKRLIMSQKAKKDGADELDAVMNIPAAKHGKWKEILDDLREICKILPTKVIIGSGYLTDEEIKKASQVAKEAGAFCVKTATEKDPLEHRELKEKFYHLGIMKKAAPGLLIKASGNIKTLKDVKEAIKASADIIGTSSGVKIVQEI